MGELVVTAASQLTEADLSRAKLGPRSSRLDLASKLALLAVEALGLNFDNMRRERIGICLSARAGSVSTDVDYWNGRALAGGPSPTLFAYTLPSAAIGEIAIRHQLTGPNLCFIGGGSLLLAEACDLIYRREVDGCVCVLCNVITAEAAEMIGGASAAKVCAAFVTEGGIGYPLTSFDRDMEVLCAKVCARDQAT